MAGAALLALLAACGGEPAPAPAPKAGATPAPIERARTIGELAGRAVRRPPVLFLGLDGADWQLLEPWLVSGAMPNLDRLRREGTWGELETETPPLSPLLWTTMMTGVSPLEHGVLDFSRYRPGDGEREPITRDEREAPALWNAATWAGKRVAVFGLWATYPAEAVEGVLVSDRLFGFLNIEDEPPAGAVYPPHGRSERRPSCAGSGARPATRRSRTICPGFRAPSTRSAPSPSAPTTTRSRRCAGS